MTDTEQIPVTIQQEAARWFALREGEEMSAGDEESMARWLAADPLHARAFSQAETIWHGLQATGLKSNGPSSPPSNMRPAIASPHAGFRRNPHQKRNAFGKRWQAASAIAASLAVVLVFGGDIATQIQADAVTATGEQREINLPDGSVALLNTGSAIAFDDDGRTVWLLKGEAAFQVTPNPDKPFSVISAGGSTTALGTRFLVKQMGDTTQIAVTEHSVRVEVAGHSATLTEGESLIYGPEALSETLGEALGPAQSNSVADIDAWTRGRIRVVNQPLGEVVAEIARYHQGYIGVMDDELAKLPVSGTFDIGDPVEAIDMVQRSLGIASTRLTDRLIFLHF